VADGNMITVEQLVKVYPGGTQAVAGHDIDRAAMEVRRSIGVAMQEVGLDDLPKGRNFLVMQGLLHGQSRKEAQQRASELLELVELEYAAARKVGTYSGGMRRRIDLISALMHSPSLLFLDEPTTALDPQSRLAIWDHLQNLNHQGITIFLTTQMMEEADRLCGRPAIIDQGQIVAEGSPEALKDRQGGDVISITIQASTDDARGAEDSRGSDHSGRQELRFSSQCHLRRPEHHRTGWRDRCTRLASTP
jgi:ABC-2 type transport system ATP-binding protein